MAYVKPKTFGSETLGGIWHNPNIGWFNKTLRTGLAGVGKANWQCKYLDLFWQYLYY